MNTTPQAHEQASIREARRLINRLDILRSITGETNDLDTLSFESIQAEITRLEALATSRIPEGDGEPNFTPVILGDWLAGR